VRPKRAVHRRVGHPLERVDVVGGDQLAPLALECRIWSEVDPRANAEGPGWVVGRMFRHRFGRLRTNPSRHCEVVVSVETLVDRDYDAVRIGVLDACRIEAVLWNRKRDAKRLDWLGTASRRSKHGDKTGAEQTRKASPEELHIPLRIFLFSTTIAGAGVSVEVFVDARPAAVVRAGHAGPQLCLKSRKSAIHAQRSSRLHFSRAAVGV